ncbi:hypothetical protein AgCh_039505 [Apium graveolens]
MNPWPFKVICDDANKPKIVVKYKGVDKHLSPEELSSMVLIKMKQIAEEYLGKKVKNAVVTVPAHFINDSQRQATKDAATIAGLDVLRILVEPTSAVAAYGLDQKLTSGSSGEKTVLIFYLGGGTFDVSLLKKKKKKDNIKVLATAGDTHLGGKEKGRLTENEIEMMILDAEMYRAEDEEFKRKIKAMNAFEDYAYNLRSAIRAKRNLKAADQKKLEEVIKVAIEWVDRNKSAEADEYESKKRELKDICNDIIASYSEIRIEEIE